MLGDLDLRWSEVERMNDALSDYIQRRFGQANAIPPVTCRSVR
jgi:hypothetical protein